jgi:hypothetical protein
MSLIESLGDFSNDYGAGQGKCIEYSFTFAGHKVIKEAN